MATIHSGLGKDGMFKFGYLDRLNGLDRLPYWKKKPCYNITASEGSFFPPRDITKSDTVYVYDKDLCRIIPLKYVKSVVKDGEKKKLFKFFSKLIIFFLFKSGIDADLYELPKDAYGGKKKENQCFNDDEYEAENGLQNISPCQYGKKIIKYLN